jgi:hypothetical protein
MMPRAAAAVFRRIDLLLAGLFLLLHLSVAAIYCRIFGVTILADEWNTWDWFWQTLPLDTLRTDLWRSIWFLHAQPPLFNLYGGILAKLFYPYHLEALQITNVLLGGLLSALVYVVAIHLTSRRSIAVVWALILSLNPSLFLYEAYILYTLISAFLVFLNLSCVLWHKRTRSEAALYCFVGSLNLLILTRSVYHVVLIPVALIFVWLISERNGRTRRILICTAICFLSLSWYAKNYSLFGFFGASSWSGMGLWRIASADYTSDELHDLSEAGILDSVVVERSIFLLPHEYEAYGFQKSSQIAVLSNDDYNNINIPDVSAEFGRNAVRLIVNSPWRYMRSLWQTYKWYCKPSSRFKHLPSNAERIAYHEKLYADFLQGAAIMSKGRMDYGTFLFVLLPSALVLYLVQLLVRCFKNGWAFSEVVRNDSLLFWCFVIISYTTVVVCSMEYGENDRFKFLVEQPIWLFIPVVLSRIKWWGKTGRTKRLRADKAANQGI